MQVSNNGIELIKQFEGLRLKAYKDAVGVWTIGYGNTYYPWNNKKVTSVDAITKKEADEMLLITVYGFGEKVNKKITAAINQNQFDALVSFTYNVGITAFAKSTLLKKVNINPCQESIRNEFNRWVYAKKKKLTGLIKRREAEADLYFKIDK